jgi:hypothetical protein
MIDAAPSQTPFYRRQRHHKISQQTRLLLRRNGVTRDTEIPPQWKVGRRFGTGSPANQPTCWELWGNQEL